MNTVSTNAQPSVNWSRRSLRLLLVAALLLTLVTFMPASQSHDAAARANGLSSASQVMSADGQPARLGVNWNSGITMMPY